LSRIQGTINKHARGACVRGPVPAACSQWELCSAVSADIVWHSAYTVTLLAPATHHAQRAAAAPAPRPSAPCAPITRRTSGAGRARRAGRAPREAYRPCPCRCMPHGPASERKRQARLGKEACQEGPPPRGARRARGGAGGRTPRKGSRS